jgi:hypothetical protein
MLQSCSYTLLRIDNLINAAGHWFLQSGIVGSHGGVARYYRADLQQNAPVSTEITGYAVSALLFLHQRTHEGAYLEAALKCARFLTRAAWDKELATFPFERLERTATPLFAYFFDSGIIARALLQAWRVTEDAEFRDCAIAAGRAMLSDFCTREGGRFIMHPILELPSKRPVAWGTRWSARPGCYQLKSALAWYELFTIAGAADFAQAYESALAAALADGPEFLPGAPDPHEVMDRLHAYAYFLEGLLPVIDRPECAAALRSGVERIAAHLCEIAPVFVRSDVYAQLLRLRLFAEAAGVLPLDRSAAAYEAQQAASYQIPAAASPGDLRLAGGFLFGRKKRLDQIEDLPFVNPVSTAFGLQALALWKDREGGRPIVSYRELI